MLFGRNRIGRNQPCPCGSGKKFKQCCMHRVPEHPQDLTDTYWRRYNIRIKSQDQINGIREAGKLVIELLDIAEESIKPGITTGELNTILHDYTIQKGATPAPLNYRGFPKSVCISRNDVICHGIPGDEIIEDGDIVNVDVTPILEGYYADANKTFTVGQAENDATAIVQAAKEALQQGLQQTRPGNTIGDIGWAIQNYAEGRGYSVVREFVGHGVGLEFHERPEVPHYGRKGAGIPLVPGMVFTVEPMINAGGKDLYVMDDGWTAKTKDGSLSAQFEQTIVITDDGYESLTPYPLT